MTRPLYKLSARAIRSLPAGKHGDGGGLWLIKASPDAGYWMLRTTVDGRRREMGLGSIAVVPLKAAREEAAKWRAIAASGVDPIRERERLAREAARNLNFFAEIADDCFETRKHELKGAGMAGRWRSPIDLHLDP